MIRLFAALALPASVRETLVAWAAPIVAADPALRALPAESLHATLVFLGAQEQAELTAIAAAVRAAEAGVFAIPATGAAWLPPRRPGVLVADLEASSELLASQRALSEALRPYREPDARPYRPHVTVARVRRGQHPRTLEVPAPPAVVVEGARVVLFRSHLGPRGARYEALT